MGCEIKSAPGPTLEQASNLIDCRTASVPGGSVCSSSMSLAAAADASIFSAPRPRSRGLAEYDKP
eukprot:6184926-Pleurochrysis_carterae.AAC.2